MVHPLTDHSTLKRHLKEKHPKAAEGGEEGGGDGELPRRRFSCGLCGKEFLRRTIVVGHVGRVHKITR